MSALQNSQVTNFLLSAVGAGGGQSAGHGAVAGNGSTIGQQGDMAYV